MCSSQESAQLKKRFFFLKCDAMISCIGKEGRTLWQNLSHEGKVWSPLARSLRCCPAGCCESQSFHRGRWWPPVFDRFWLKALGQGVPLNLTSILKFHNYLDKWLMKCICLHFIPDTQAVTMITISIIITQLCDQYLQRCIWYITGIISENPHDDQSCLLPLLLFSR
jgi:hypothetical protein